MVFHRCTIPCLYALTFLILMWPASGATAQESRDGFLAMDPMEWFEKRVRPLLAEQCFSCHSESAGTQKGGLRVDSRQSLLAGGDSGPAIVPGKPEASLLVEAIRRESFEMPPEKPLSPEDCQVLEQWIRLGAPWPEEAAEAASGDWFQQRLRTHWAWQPIEPSQAIASRQSEAAEDAWSSSTIDRFIKTRLNESQLEPATPASPEILWRRLSFDLTGLPPDAALLSRDKSGISEASYEQAVDRLLASPQFGVVWGRHWMDLMRYAETLGHEFDYPLRDAWRYRDAVVDAFNVDLPYDRFLLEHLAGDQLEDVREHPLTGLNQSLAMTGFWWLGDSVHAPTDLLGDWATRVDNQIDVVSKAFLGMTVACARCHDHKFDAIRMRDYYGLAGMLESTRRVYALTDPGGQIAEHCTSQLGQQLEADRQAASAYATSNLTHKDSARRWIFELVDRLAALPTEEQERLLPISSPLYPLRAFLSQDGFSEELAVLRSNLREASRDYEQWLAGSELFADFSQGVPAGWRVDSVDNLGPQRVGHSKALQLPPLASPQSEWVFDWYSAELPIPIRSDVFSSHQLGNYQQLVLQSPVFDVRQPVACIQGRGKSIHSALFIDNYFMNEFHQLLFHDTRKLIEQTHDSGWWYQAGDLQKYVGETAYLSIEDFGRGWFEIAQVRFASELPPQQPSSMAMQWLGAEAGSAESLSAESLSAVMAEELSQAFAGVGKSRDEVDSAMDSVELLRWVVTTATSAEVPVPGLLEMSEVVGKLQAADEASPSPAYVLAAAESSPRDTAIALRGDPRTRGESVARVCLAELSTGVSAAEMETSGRLEFAHQLLQPEHPLTARVIVNRVWYHLMGRGLVESTDNLGVLGGRPSHPELLDYLASELRRHDWSLKWLVREIVTSQCYRLSSRVSEQQQNMDATGALYSRRSIRRLSAEAIRDSMLLVAGELDRRLAGESVPVHLKPQMTGRGRPKDTGPLNGAGRRSLYVEVRRNFLDPFLLAFDFPSPSTAVGNRSRSNVPAQALGMWNDSLVNELARRWVDRSSAESDAEKRVQRMFIQAYGRPPEQPELESC
ncbi:MAG: PSD1 and planctomycete cytochrome C domain-containing protein, partial [bacterium]|nr:PSD1 and planctomycete cytochrome C domain-containing protein [bacterium]